MGLIGIITSELEKLNQSLSASSAVHPEDVVGVKTRLQREGYYDIPSYGLTPYPDSRLFEGIRKFQRDNGLAVDGVMNPGGETEQALRYPIQMTIQRVMEITVLSGLVGGRPMTSFPMSMQRGRCLTRWCGMERKAVRSLCAKLSTRLGGRGSTLLI